MESVDCIKIKRQSYLNILKGIGIFLVAFAHIFSNNISFNWIYSFHMPLFFFAAGWLYFFFGSLTLLYWQIIERRFRDSDLNFVQSLFGLVSGQYDYLDFNVHLWFLPCFFTVVVFIMLL